MLQNKRSYHAPCGLSFMPSPGGVQLPEVFSDELMLCDARGGDTHHAHAFLISSEVVCAVDFAEG